MKILCFIKMIVIQMYINMFVCIDVISNDSVISTVSAISAMIIQSVLIVVIVKFVMVIYPDISTINIP